MNLVVFHDHGCHILDPLLEKGFRHCFAAVQTGDYWVTIDGKAERRIRVVDLLGKLADVLSNRVRSDASKRRIVLVMQRRDKTTGLC